jgi:tRNA threonylcarbamoyl adenosine modification protein YjeE
MKSPPPKEAEVGTMPIQVTTARADHTLALGQKLAPQLAEGDIVLLHGPLGAGKTLLTRGIVGGLKAEAAPLVTSQSYVIAGEYPTTPRVTHLDLYRLSTTEEVIALGYEELIYGEGRLSVVEWPDLLLPLLDADDAVITITFAVGETPDQRVIVASSPHPRLTQAFRRAAHAAQLTVTSPVPAG